MRNTPQQCNETNTQLTGNGELGLLLFLIEVFDAVNLITKTKFNLIDLFTNKYKWMDT